MLNWSSSSLWVAGLELGVWYFGGSATQAIGLGLTTALRAGFLIQLISLLVPSLAYLRGEAVSRRTWGCCAIALVGAVFITLDGKWLLHSGSMTSAAATTAATTTTAAAFSSLSSSSSPQVVGDLVLILSCCFYALATVRLSTYAKVFPPTVLASARYNALLMFGAGWFMWQNWEVMVSLGPLSALWGSYRDPEVLGWLLYIGIVPGALAGLLQAVGQRRVKAAEAQVR